MRAFVGCQQNASNCADSQSWWGTSRNDKPLSGRKTEPCRQSHRPVAAARPMTALLVAIRFLIVARLVNDHFFRRKRRDQRERFIRSAGEPCLVVVRLQIGVCCRRVWLRLGPKMRKRPLAQYAAKFWIKPSATFAKESFAGECGILRLGESRRSCSSRRIHTLSPYLTLHRAILASGSRRPRTLGIVVCLCAPSHGTYWGGQKTTVKTGSGQPNVSVRWLHFRAVIPRHQLV